MSVPTHNNQSIRNIKANLVVQHVMRELHTLYGINPKRANNEFKKKVMQAILKNHIMAIGRLQSAINKKFPPNPRDTKQNRFRKFFLQPNNNQTRTPPSINNIINKRMQLIYKYYRITPPTSNPILRNFVLNDWRESSGNVSNNAAFNRLKKKIKKISPPAWYAPRQFNYIDFIKKLQPKRPQTPPVAAPPGPDPFNRRAARIGRNVGPNSVRVAGKAVSALPFLL